MHLQHTTSLFSHWALQKSNCPFTAHPLQFRANIFAVLNEVHYAVNSVNPFECAVCLSLASECYGYDPVSQVPSSRH